MRQARRSRNKTASDASTEPAQFKLIVFLDDHVL
jgi:hypothetical protein